MTTSETAKKRKRRPGRDHENHSSSGEDSVASTPASEEGSVASQERTEESHGNRASAAQAEPPPPFHDQPERKHVNLHFVGADVLKDKAPKVFDLAQTVADEWVNDGSFNNLNLGHPVAEMVASMGLREAKKIEKKLEEKGVFALAKMGLEYAKNRWKK